MERKIFFAAGVLLVVFNLWHGPMRGIWNGSVLDSLTVGEWVAPLANQTDPAIPTLKKSYDGQYFYAMAFDPLLVSREYLQYLDLPRYRYRRMLYPLLGYVASFGQPKIFPYALFFINMFVWVLLAYVGYRIAVFEHLPRIWIVLGVFFQTGMTFTVFRTLSEPLALLLGLWGCYQWRRERPLSAILFFGLSGLARETALLVPLSVFVYESFKPGGSVKRMMAFFILSVLPAGFWALYVGFRIENAGNLYSDAFGPPFVAFYTESMRFLSQAPTYREIMRTLSVNAVVLGMTLVGFVYVFRRPSFWGGLAFGQAVLCAFAKLTVWEHHAGSVRIAVFLMTFSIIWYFKMAMEGETHIKQGGEREY
ncbi:MAG TPA: hypothetical protein PK876_09365 [Elusimicrobiota bacterium]|nr:hypothetical protein [Elusimicrobiota bacterium]